jgi:hypothetical protein
LSSEEVKRKGMLSSGMLSRKVKKKKKKRATVYLKLRTRVDVA